MELPIAAAASQGGEGAGRGRSWGLDSEPRGQRLPSCQHTSTRKGIRGRQRHSSIMLHSSRTSLASLSIFEPPPFLTTPSSPSQSRLVSVHVHTHNQHDEAMATSGLHFSKRERDSTGTTTAKSRTKQGEGRTTTTIRKKRGHHMPPHAPCNNPNIPKQHNSSKQQQQTKHRAGLQPPRPLPPTRSS